MNFEIEGMDKVVNEIKKLNDRTKRTEILKILRNQMKPIQNAVKAKAPKHNKVVIRTNKSGQKFTYEVGNLSKSISIITQKRTKEPIVFVMPKIGKRAKNDGYYARFVIYGTKDIAPNNFVHDAANPMLNSVNKTATTELKKYIDRKIKTLNL